MAYFIHNKYDSNSSAKVTHVSGTSYTYKEDPGVTVIDFFGNMEAGVNTYRNLDTTYMGIKPVDELTYTTIDEDSLIGNGQTTDGASNLEYATGILPIVEKLQEITGQASDTGGSESVGTIMAKLNAIIAELVGLSLSVVQNLESEHVEVIEFSISSSGGKPGNGAVLGTYYFKNKFTQIKKANKQAYHISADNFYPISPLSYIPDDNGITINYYNDKIEVKHSGSGYKIGGSYMVIVSNRFI